MGAFQYWCYRDIATAPGGQKIPIPDGDYIAKGQITTETGTAKTSDIIPGETKFIKFESDTATRLRVGCLDGSQEPATQTDPRTLADKPDWIGIKSCQTFSVIEAT